MPFPNTPPLKDRKPRERVMTSDGVMLGKGLRDMRLRMRPGVFKPTAGAKELISSTFSKARDAITNAKATIKPKAQGIVEGTLDKIRKVL